MTWSRVIDARHQLGESFYSSQADSVKKVPRDSKQVAAKLVFVAWLCFEKQRYATCRKLLHEALQLRELALGKNHRKLVPIIVSLAQVEAATGKPDAAEDHFIHAMKILSRKPGRSLRQEADLLQKFASFLESQDRYEEAHIACSSAARCRLQSREPWRYFAIANVTPSLCFSRARKVLPVNRLLQLARDPIVLLCLIGILILLIYLCTRGR